MGFKINKLTPTLGAEIKGIDFSKTLDQDTHDKIYKVLLNNLVIFFRQTNISPKEHLKFASKFGQIDVPHPLYPKVKGYKNIVLLENDSKKPPDTDSWHTDLTFKKDQPFASILVARNVPKIGGDTMWSSLYAAYNRLSKGMKKDLTKLSAVHDMGDFRNNFASKKGNKSSEQRLNENLVKFGQCIRPLIGTHPVTAKKFLNFNEAFVTHIIGLNTNDSKSLQIFLANHMNKPEDQVRWRWQKGDIAMWDNRVTMHYAINDYLPQYRCMNRVTVVNDCRVK